MVGKGDDRCVVAFPNPLGGVLDISLHCQEICRDVSQLWALDPKASLPRGHGGK